MQLEDYFEFEKFPTKFGETERIRIKGSRIAIEIVIGEFHQGATPEQIQHKYPTLSLAQVYATIAYYLQNKAAVDAYIERGERVADAYYQEYLQHGPYFLRDEALGSQAKPEKSSDDSVHE
jgi:uncharacterized protein (DUF433 family)